MSYVIQATICNQNYYAEMNLNSRRLNCWQGLIENATHFCSRQQAEQWSQMISHNSKIPIEVKSKQELLKLKSRI